LNLRDSFQRLSKQTRESSRGSVLPEGILPVIIRFVRGKKGGLFVDEPLAQRILDLIFQDPQLRRLHKESLADWILDTQPRTAPLDATALLQYLGAHQPELLNRLKINVRLKEDLARVLESIERN
jgi:hypothetical protein